MTHDVLDTHSWERMARGQLAALFASYGIDCSQWGLGGSKSLDDLVTELQEGESRLEEQGGQLVRHVDGVGVDVLAEVNGQRYRLVESHQVYTADGAVRHRHLSTSLGEKMKAGELPVAVMVRALQEELGIIVEESMFHAGDTTRELVPSEAFPGLMTDRGLTYGVVMIHEADFAPDGYTEVQHAKTTYFVWDEL